MSSGLAVVYVSFFDPVLLSYEYNRGRAIYVYVHNAQTQVPQPTWATTTNCNALPFGDTPVTSHPKGNFISHTSTYDLIQKLRWNRNQYNDAAVDFKNVSNVSHRANCLKGVSFDTLNHLIVHQTSNPIIRFNTSHCMYVLSFNQFLIIDIRVNLLCS